MKLYGIKAKWFKKAPAQYLTICERRDDFTDKYVKPSVSEFNGNVYEFLPKRAVGRNKVLVLADKNNITKIFKQIKDIRNGKVNRQDAYRSVYGNAAIPIDICCSYFDFEIYEVKL